MEKKQEKMSSTIWSEEVNCLALYRLRTTQVWSGQSFDGNCKKKQFISMFKLYNVSFFFWCMIFSTIDFYIFLFIPQTNKEKKTKGPMDH